MRVVCPSCGRSYELGEDAQARSLRCACGCVVTAAPAEARQAEILRCAACGGPVGGGDEVCPYCGGTVDREAAHRTLVCPDCYAANVPDARYCAHCGKPFLPVSWEVFASDLRCPRCSEGLEGRLVEELRYEECPSCRGMWLSREVFQAAVERKEREFAERPDGPWQPEPVRLQPVEYLRCPVCGQLMNRKNFGKRSGVIVDECPAHGLWLDAGELDRIARFVAQGGLAEARRRQAEETRRLAESRARMAALDEHPAGSYRPGRFLDWMLRFLG